MNKDPKIPHEIISPIPTVTAKNRIEPSKLYAYAKMRGIIIVFERIGGRSEIYFFFRRIYVKIAPIKVARLPKITSINMLPVRIFERRHPTNRPGIAAGV